MTKKLGIRIKLIERRGIRFFRDEIWRVDKATLGTKRFNIYNIIKSFILASRSITGSELNTRAAALTYNTLLSIVPLLAVLLGIARGFGFQNILKSELFKYFSGQEAILAKGFSFVDNSLKYAQGGVFLGVGIVALLYTVVNLFSNIEESFNAIWSIKKSRSYYRQFTDYFALFVIIPLFIVFNSTLSVLLNMSSHFHLIGFVVDPLVKLVPFIITIGLFVFIYSYIPNTKVRFTSALFAGLFSGICFQLFQIFYISGQIWISKYNAIYGSFAALPLFLLWVQTSWLICLFGVELAFANQNIEKFSFERESNSISRRYKDFLTLLVVTLIVKRFEKGEKPYTADELSGKYKIPTRLTADIIESLQEVKLLIETPSSEPFVSAYLPAIDINKISVSYLFNKMDIHGSEDFNIDTNEVFESEWNAVLDTRKIASESGDRLLKDL